MIVEVYRNLNQPGITYSVRSTCADRYNRLVIAHVAGIVLSDVEFRVSVAGRDRVRQTGRKNVHALVRGEVVAVKDLRPRRSQSHQLITGTPWNPTPSGCLIKYNPYKYDTFVVAETNSPIYRCDMVQIDESGILMLG